VCGGGGAREREREREREGLREGERGTERETEDYVRRCVRICVSCILFSCSGLHTNIIRVRCVRSLGVCMPYVISLANLQEDLTI
jgi:hypothetical protein